jgi:glycosyltransferase involved in cell wall biosynthesis
MTPKRLAYVLNIFPKLSETFIVGELAELCRRGVELRILSLLPPREELQHGQVNRAGLDQLVCYEPENFSAVLNEFQPQLLHAHFAREATAEARRLAVQHHLPFTFTAHGYDIHRKPPEDFAARAVTARAVVTVSEANASYITATFGVPRERIRIISCGVDTERFHPGDAATLATPPLILCVARHVAVKDLGRLLEACAQLRLRGLDFRCVMIGDGPLHEELKAKRAELALSNLVAMPGAAEQGEVLQWWQRASIGVLTSQNEGMPVSLMEAAACGVPVVAPAVGGIPELVQDGVTGLLARPNDLAGLVAALEKLLRDPAQRSRLGAAARQRAVEKFSVRHQVDQLLALWTDVLNGTNT